MKKILIQTPDRQSIFGPDVNNQNEKTRLLKQRLSELGYELLQDVDTIPDDTAWIIFLDSMSIEGFYGGWKRRLRKLLKKKPASATLTAPQANLRLYEEALRRGMRDKLVLFLWEGHIVNPYNYRRALWRKFDRILTWDDGLVDDKKFFKFCLPTPPRTTLPPLVPFGNKKLLVNISANKWFRGHHELFSARAKTSLYFDTHYPQDFDLFGSRWDVPTSRWQKWFPSLMPKYTCHRGTTPDKMATISRYKFALAYENLSDSRGYVTEKIFDILQARSVPVYWGAPNIAEYVDPAAFVDRRKFEGDAALAEYLRNVTEAEYDKMLAAGHAYLQSDKFKRFSPEHFCDRIIEILKLS